MMNSKHIYPQRLLKVSEVASILSVSKAFVYKLIRAREIQSVQLLGTKRIRQEDLDRYITSNLKDPLKKGLQ